MVLHARVVSGSGGGPDKTILRSPRYVDASRYRMAAAYIHPAGDNGFDAIRQQARRERCPLLEVPEAGPVDPRTFGRMLHICQDHQVDIWHGHDYKSNLLGLMLNRLHPMKLVTTVHGWTWDTPRTRFYYHIDNACLPRYDHVVAVSSKLHGHCLGLGVNESRLTYIPNAIEADVFTRRQSREQAKAKLGIEQNTFAIGVVGRLSVEKGVDRAVTLLRDVMRQRADVRLHLIGDGPERARIERMAEDAGVRQAITFHGWQRESLAFYEMFDMLLLPSHTEGLPNVVLEAMAMEVPVAATDVGGVRELLDEGRCGVILSQDEHTWHNAIAAMLTDPSVRQDMTRMARQRIEQHYTFQRRMERMVAVYDHVMAASDQTTARHAA